MNTFLYLIVLVSIIGCLEPEVEDIDIPGPRPFTVDCTTVSELKYEVGEDVSGDFTKINVNRKETVLSATGQCGNITSGTIDTKKFKIVKRVNDVITFKFDDQSSEDKVKVVGTKIEYTSPYPIGGNTSACINGNAIKLSLIEGSLDTANKEIVLKTKTQLQRGCMTTSLEGEKSGFLESIFFD